MSSLTVIPRRSSPRDKEAEAEANLPRSLAEFISDLRDAARFADGLRADLRTLAVDLDDDTIFRAAQAAFEADAARRSNLKDHIALRRLRQADRSIAQRERAFEFDAAEAVLKNLPAIRAIDADRTLPRPDKIQAIRLHLFGAPPTTAKETVGLVLADDENDNQSPITNHQ